VGEQGRAQLMSTRNLYEVFMTRDGEGTSEATWHRVEREDVGGGLLATAEAAVAELNAAEDGHEYELMDAHLIGTVEVDEQAEVDEALTRRTRQP
jgi:hypothetical protein